MQNPSKGQIQSFNDLCKRQIKKTFFDTSGFTALLVGTINNDDQRYVDHSDSLLNIFGTEAGQEVDSSVRRVRICKEICDVMLMDRQRPCEEVLRADGL